MGKNKRIFTTIQYLEGLMTDLGLRKANYRRSFAEVSLLKIRHKKRAQACLPACALSLFTSELALGGEIILKAFENGSFRLVISFEIVAVLQFLNDLLLDFVERLGNIDAEVHHQVAHFIAITLYGG